MDIRLQRFPQQGPDVESVVDDPEFNPAVHLCLEKPRRHYTLSDLGYTSALPNEHTASEIAMTESFRVLSDEGVAALCHVCKQLEAYTTSNPRISRSVRGSVYRSRFIRELSICDEVTEHLSQLMCARLLPHAMGHQLAHLNYQPVTLGENVDKWHYDTLQVDYVMFVTNPNEVEGGEFQFFKGTRDEMAALKDDGEPIPADRVIAPELPGAGYAVLMQGNYVVHQARGLQAPGERITFVNGYSFADPLIPDYTAYRQLKLADPVSIVSAEYARQMAYRCAQHLITCVNQPDFESSQTGLDQLRRARAELDIAIEALEDDSIEEIKHFGD